MTKEQYEFVVIRELVGLPCEIYGRFKDAKEARKLRDYKRSAHSTKTRPDIYIVKVKEGEDVQ